MHRLTDKQREILDNIKSFINKNGYSPSIREICKIANLNSPATMYAHLNNLKEKGYISWIDGKARTIRVMEVK